MARRRDSANTSCSNEGDRSMQDKEKGSGKDIARTMPLTQEKHLDSNFTTNNNDHSYLHKKFKKMASTVPAYTAHLNKTDIRQKEAEQTALNSTIPNGSISAAHPEIEKIKEKQNKPIDKDKNVQINVSQEIKSSICDVNTDRSGQTSFVDEFAYKTENYETNYISEAHNGGTGGRYMCPYCKLSCAKPSVLQKHIRAHTNERPYPCVPCGFAFKTKSNLYKHRKSRTHALRLQGADVSAIEEDLSGGSESDTSLPPTSISDAGSEISNVRVDNFRASDFSSPELSNDRVTSPHITYENNKSKSIYKPKFRAAMYKENEERDRLKRSISSNADFLTEHISKIISDNEAIVDVIETPLQKKYGKIKQIAESKQFLSENANIKIEPAPLNLTKNNTETDCAFRKRSQSESFSQIDFQKHPLNPEGSIIKDLLLKTKANGLASLVSGETVDGIGALFICHLCQIIFRSADNLETHRLYYCKGSISSATTLLNNTTQKDAKGRPEIFVRSNSINVRLPEVHSNLKLAPSTRSPPLRNKPDNLVIAKSENNEVIAPLQSPGPLLGNTRLVDTRASDYVKNENLRFKSMASPKRKYDMRSDSYSPRQSENNSPRSDIFSQSKIRCLDGNSSFLRPVEDIHNSRHSTSLQMFGGEVKIIDHLGSTTTLRIEPSKNQLSPILVQQSLSPSKLANDAESSSVVVRSGLHSGGTILHNPPTPKESNPMPSSQNPRISISSSSSMLSTNMSKIHGVTHFEFPPLTNITAYNPLTLPPLSPGATPNGAMTILHGGKLIPHVPGIPGPNTQNIIVSTPRSIPSKYVPTSEVPKMNREYIPEGIHGNIVTARETSLKYETAPSRNLSARKHPGDTERQSQMLNIEIPSYSTVPIIKVRNVDESNNSLKTSPNPLKSFINRIDLPMKRNSDGVPKVATKDVYSNQMSRTKTENKVENKTDATEIRHFNFESMITKAEIFNNQLTSSLDEKSPSCQEITSSTSSNERTEKSYFQKCVVSKANADERKPKFLRPSTLPLKPGTFTPKKHHGITPNANTMPLVSPETPRPAKAYGQLYLNGNAYTYLGLKCSTKSFYCTINRPQPTYVPNQHFLSMYSNWQLLSELTPDPLGLSASSAMSLYDSRHRPQNVAVSVMKHELILTHSSQWKKRSKDSKQESLSADSKRTDEKSLSESITPKKELAGGFESNEEYTYVRGRGRGRYVCSECGIRCKKPSMLKKHIRTHTDVRPYTCVHCAFSFKTKGNLTKHMKSKAHYKKCCELGITSKLINFDNENENSEMAQCSGETDDETDSDGDEGNEGETESSDTETCKSRLPEHEAAHCLLSLGGSRPTTSATPGLITSARPTTYPYAPAGLDNGLLELTGDNRLYSSSSIESKSDNENEPMDLSKSEMKNQLGAEIPTARESSVLASLASNTAKLPQQQTQWTNGEPMLHTYLTERALLDSKIKQSQVTTSLSKARKIDVEKAAFIENTPDENKSAVSKNNISTSISDKVVSVHTALTRDSDEVQETNNDKISSEFSSNPPTDMKRTHVPCSTNAENAKFVVSEYLKHARINLVKKNEDPSNKLDNLEGINDLYSDDKSKLDEFSDASDPENIKIPSLEHDPVARKVVIGAGGVAYKVSKGKEFEGSQFTPGRLMEDGRRVCDFCNKTFTKPSQLRLHLNIHYMERPFRCNPCAVSFRTRGHLQKHERSVSHHNKVSMTSTFGAATSSNPRPFRCSDCNIAFRIHGHLAKHLRSKMHVMRLECLFKLPFGTFTEIERAGVSLTDIDTTDCESSLASLQALARKLHEKDPTKLEYREPSAHSAGRESSEEEDAALPADKHGESDKEGDTQTYENSEIQETGVNYSATDN